MARVKARKETQMRQTDSHATNSPALIRYFRDCLLADSGERELNDILASGEKEHLFLPLEETATTGIPSGFTLPSADGERLTATLQLMRQELKPLLGTYLIMGRDTEDRQTQVRTPLFLVEVNIENTNKEFRIVPDPESLRINSSVLSALGLPREWESLALPGNTRFASLMEHLNNLPHSAKPQCTDDLRLPRNGQLTASHSAVLWLSRRSRTAASIAFELEAMAQANTLSCCLEQLLGKRSTASPGPNPVPESLPNRLTRAQEQALLNASRDTLSVVHGAPGTGKTYTIAGIVADRVMRGESVLIACSNEHAADVVYDQLGKSFTSAGRMAVRAGQGDYRKQLLLQLDSLLTMRSDSGMEDLEALTGKLRRGIERQRRNAGRFRDRLKRSEQLSEALQTDKRNWPHRLLRFWIAWRTRRRPLLARSWCDYRQHIDNHQQLARKLLAASTTDRHFRLIRHNRQQLAGLATALRTRSSGNRAKRMGNIDWQILTRAFPVWVVSTQTLYRSLPLKPELFDLVIMDEATQCNIAQALPALQRARRAVIAGDPKQLRHFSFLARARQGALARDHGVSDAPISLDYRERSLLDYAINQLPHADAQVWLDEHFRSHPHLIDFSNQRFYQNRLKILTDTRRILNRPPRQIIECPVQLNNDINEGEIQTLMEYLSRLISEAEKLPEMDIPSIGVLCFFSSSARVLEKRILNEFTLADLTRHNLLVATPYGFQGIERDLILVASGVYPGRSSAAWTYMERPDVFNVAITRARHRQILFVPKDFDSTLRPGLFLDYLRHDPQPPQPDSQEDRLYHNSRQQMIAEMETRGIRCWSDFTVGGQAVDLLAVKGEQALAIDLIGCPTEFGKAWSLDRYSLLERAGLPPLPITYGEWIWRREEILALLDNLLRSNDSNPAAEQSKKFADLQWRFEKLGVQTYLDILNRLAQSYEQLDLWLGRRFSSGELSYHRYKAGIDNLIHTTLIELAGIALLLEEGQTLMIPDTDLVNSLAAPTEKSHKAVNALTNLAHRLAMMENNSGIETALVEITELENRLSAYEGLLRNPGKAMQHD
jgi:hypothetical protein